MPPNPPAPDEWDQLVVKIGKLTLAVGILEMTIITLVCRILGQNEEEFGYLTNSAWCKKLNEIAPKDWTEVERNNLATHLEEIRGLYRKRNGLIHAALGVVAGDFIPGVPAGSVIDLRTFGMGFTSREGDTWTIGHVGTRVDLDEIDRLTGEVHQARIDLVPYMELVDKIKHPPKPFPAPVLGKRL